MRHLIALTTLLLLTACSSAHNQGPAAQPAPARVVSSVDATNSWNTYCAIFHFDEAPAAALDTFADIYSGSDFTRDFSSLKQVVAADLQTSTPTWDGNELVNANLEAWPE